mgnify:CR=1 FL=1
MLWGSLFILKAVVDHLHHHAAGRFYELLAAVENVHILIANLPCQGCNSCSCLLWEAEPTGIQQGKAAGVVTRQDKDVEVTLSARVSFDKETAVAEYTVKVLKAPDIISEDKYQGYLFGHFIGEGSSDGEQIYFALSEDGLNFKDMNGHKPVLISNVGEKGVRDPYIYRSYEGDRFFLVATDLSIYNRGGWLKNEQGY